MAVELEGIDGGVRPVPDRETVKTKNLLRRVVAQRRAEEMRIEGLSLVLKGTLGQLAVRRAEDPCRWP